MLKKIYNVGDVNIKLLRKQDHKYILLVVATGTVISGGWSNPVLIPYYYYIPPSDGIYEFDFAAQAPNEQSTSVMQPIDVAFIWEDVPINDFKGVKINASSNSKCKSLAEKLSEDDQLCVWHRPGF